LGDLIVRPLSLVVTGGCPLATTGDNKAEGGARGSR